MPREDLTKGKNNSNNIPTEQLTRAQNPRFRAEPAGARAPRVHTPPPLCVTRACAGSSSRSRFSPGSCLVLWVLAEEERAPLPPRGAGDALAGPSAGRGLPAPSSRPRPPGFWARAAACSCLKSGVTNDIFFQLRKKTQLYLCIRQERVHRHPVLSFAAANDNMMTYSTIRKLFLCN